MTNINLSKKPGGFTLIELMITVAIIGILASVALPSYNEQIRKTRRADAMDALLSCATEQTRFYSVNSPPSYMDTTEAQGENACGYNGTDFVSSDGHYTLAITNPGCTGGNSIWCFTITATAVSNSQTSDASCRTMAIDHRGIKSSQDASSSDSTGCWRN